MASGEAMYGSTCVIGEDALPPLPPNRAPYAAVSWAMPGASAKKGRAAPGVAGAKVFVNCAPNEVCVCSRRQMPGHHRLAHREAEH